MDTTPPQGTMARHRKPSFCQKQHLRQLGRRVYGARLTLNPQVFAIHLLDAMLHLVLSTANKSPCTLRSRRLAGLPGPRPPPPATPGARALLQLCAQPRRPALRPPWPVSPVLPLLRARASTHEAAPPPACTALFRTHSSDFESDLDDSGPNPGRWVVRAAGF